MSAPDDLRPLIEDLREWGEEPARFVLDRLREVDLVLFDDALHSAVEPFEFYGSLVADPEFRRLVDVIFLEVVPLNQQPHIDAYLESESGEAGLLWPAFRNDTSGTGGIGYRTYLDLLAAIREANRAGPPDESLRVVAVSNPSYWPEIRTPRDLELFHRSLAGRDYDMYRLILDELDGFRSGKKGVFLTNTRHAYTGVRDREGRFFWNTGTFFRQWHPGKTSSIRLHNVSLATEPRTAQGLEPVRWRWARIDGGRWDRAFAANGNLPIAVPLTDTTFGRAPYLGNHMPDALPDQSMANAYDAVIFLAPLEHLRQSAAMPNLYSADFVPELARRYELQRSPEDLAADLQTAGASTVEELVAKRFVEWPESPVPSVDPR